MSAATRLADAQLLVAREYGFACWRQLKAAVDLRERDAVFAAARNGDLAGVRSRRSSTDRARWSQRGARRARQARATASRIASSSIPCSR